MNTPQRVNMPSDARALLKEAAEWRLISLLFECPDTDWRTQVRALAAEVDDPALKAVVAAIDEYSAGLYHTTFGPGGPAAPREVSYRQEQLPGPALAELLEFYRAFGYQPSVPEPPDHVAVEAGFVGYLRLKQAYALLNGDAPGEATCAAAAGRFIEGHLAALVHPLARALRASGVEYLARAAEALRARSGQSPPPSMSLPIAETAEDELTCSP